MGKNKGKPRKKKRQTRSIVNTKRHRAKAAQNQLQAPPHDELPDWAEGLDNPRHILFLQQLIKLNFNQTKAYIAAGYSPNGAAESASRLLRNAKVKAAYRKLLAATSMPVEELQVRIEEDARSSAGLLDDYITVIDGVPYVDWQGVKDAGLLKYFREIKVIPGKYGPSISWKLVDDQKAKDQLIKIHGLAVNKHELTGKDGGPIKQEVADPLPVAHMDDETLAGLERAYAAQAAAKLAQKDE